MTANIRHRARQQLQRYFSYNMLKLWFSSCSALAVCRQHIDWQRMSAVDGDRVQSGWCNPSMGNSCLRCWWAISQLDQIKMREEVKQSSRDTEKCPLQLLSVLLNLYFLIFDILGVFFPHFSYSWRTLWSLSSPFWPTCQPIGIQPTHSVSHILQLVFLHWMYACL